MYEYTVRTPKQRTAILKKINAARDKGVSMAQACKDAGINVNNYYAWSGHKFPCQLKKKTAVEIFNLDTLPTLPTLKIRKASKTYTKDINELIDAVRVIDKWIR